MGKEIQGTISHVTHATQCLSKEGGFKSMLPKNDRPGWLQNKCHKATICGIRRASLLFRSSNKCRKPIFFGYFYNGIMKVMYFTFLFLFLMIKEKEDQLVNRLFW